MPETIPAKEISLNDLETKFGLRFIEDDQFFHEWQDDLPELTDAERQRLDRVKTCYTHLLKYPPMLEYRVKMVVLSPLLDLVDFYFLPFYDRSERSTSIFSENVEDSSKGKIDTLVIKDKLWLMVIESKLATYSVEVGEGQILAYMLENPNYPEQTTFGMITNGADFRFVKLAKLPTPQYAFSNTFSIRDRPTQFYSVLRILKRLIELINK